MLKVVGRPTSRVCQRPNAFFACDLTHAWLTIDMLHTPIVVQERPRVIHNLWNQGHGMAVFTVCKLLCMGNTPLPMQTVNLHTALAHGCLLSRANRHDHAIMQAWRTCKHIRHSKPCLSVMQQVLHEGRLRWRPLLDILERLAHFALHGPPKQALHGLGQGRHAAPDGPCCVVRRQHGARGPRVQ